MEFVRDIEQFRFPGPYRESICRLRIYKSEGGELGPDAVVIATERNDNPGMSITNAAESLWTLAISVTELELRLFGTGAQVMCFEHYLGAPGEKDDSALGEHFARVTFQGYDRQGVFRGPKWVHVTKAAVMNLTAPLALDRPKALSDEH